MKNIIVPLSATAVILTMRTFIKVLLVWENSIINIGDE